MRCQSRMAWKMYERESSDTCVCVCVFVCVHV